MTTLRHFLLVALLLNFQSSSLAWSIDSKHNANPSSLATMSRRDTMISAAAVAATVTAWNLPVPIAQAADYSTATPTPTTTTKRQNLSNEELATVLRGDVTVNQFMVSADISRDVYAETATFTDEIDTYQMDQWIKGTKRLFVAEKSHVDLVEESLQVSPLEASFRFTETLQFNIPILKPKTYLSGKVVFTRDPDTGLITSYREQWDQDVKTVLAKANYFSS
jgi:hypothetical protein